VGVTPDDDDSPGIQSADADCDAVAGNSAGGNSRQHVAADMNAPLCPVRILKASAGH